jgi:hypothetical protein
MGLAMISAKDTQDAIGIVGVIIAKHWSGFIWWWWLIGVEESWIFSKMLLDSDFDDIMQASLDAMHYFLFFFIFRATVYGCGVYLGGWGIMLERNQFSFGGKNINAFGGPEEAIQFFIGGGLGDIHVFDEGTSFILI